MAQEDDNDESGANACRDGMGTLLTNQKSLLTQENIEKTIYRAFENYWNTRINKCQNLAKVSPIAAQDIMKLIEQQGEYRDIEK